MLKQEIIRRGYASEVAWATGVGTPADANAFACEAIWVILNSGMREQVARIIWERMRPTLMSGGNAKDAPFGHKLKCRAIDQIWQERVRLFNCFCECDESVRLDWIESLPHIGPITKYHLARNLGMDVCKPDRHLVRIAAPGTPHDLCSQLSSATGDRIGVVDCVIWRAANLGLV